MKMHNCNQGIIKQAFTAPPPKPKASSNWIKSNAAISTWPTTGIRVAHPHNTSGPTLGLHYVCLPILPYVILLNQYRSIPQSSKTAFVALHPNLQGVLLPPTSTES